MKWRVTAHKRTDGSTISKIVEAGHRNMAAIKLSLDYPGQLIIDQVTPLGPKQLNLVINR